MKPVNIFINQNAKIASFLSQPQGTKTTSFYSNAV